MYPHDRPPFDPDLETNPTQPFYSQLNTGTLLQFFDRSLNALKRLPKEAQILVVLAVAFVGFSAIVTLIKIVNFLLSIALLGVFGYIVYKFISTPSVEDSEP
ncbi:MAG: hypothetical protein SWY16_11855 [Cyanobacteriota bacterium]|nr:hypothetical protein [Cyanobacteriota bacterium]